MGVAAPVTIGAVLPAEAAPSSLTPQTRAAATDAHPATERTPGRGWDRDGGWTAAFGRMVEARFDRNGDEDASETDGRAGIADGRAGIADSIDSGWLEPRRRDAHGLEAGLFAWPWFGVEVVDATHDGPSTRDVLHEMTSIEMTPIKASDVAFASGVSVDVTAPGVLKFSRTHGVLFGSGWAARLNEFDTEGSREGDAPRSFFATLIPAPGGAALTVGLAALAAGRSRRR